MLILPAWAGVGNLYLCICDQCLDFCVGEGMLRIVRHLMLILPEWAGICNLDLCIGDGMFGFLCWCRCAWICGGT